VSTGTTTITPLSTYRNETPYPFCPGCGHGPILDRLNEALVELELDPKQVVLVSDIGCSGLSDQYFATSAFHGLHGRSITYATGIKLADPSLTVIVVMGDGGLGIGGAHLLAAARRNVGIKLLVFNNFNFGMTGGQHSATTPAGTLTATTPEGSLERPLDACATVAANGAGYVWRGTSFDADLPARIADAVRHPGFALLDVWELCTAYFQPRNRWSKRSLQETLADLGLATGLVQKEEVAEYALAYRQLSAASEGEVVLPRRELTPRFEARLDRRFRLVVAGSAGGRVGTGVRVLARAAILSGLWAAQRGDYPVTVKSGHSLAELILGPEPIDYAGVARPDALAILTREGRAKAGPLLGRMTASGEVFVLPESADLETPAKVTVLDPVGLPPAIARQQLALAVVGEMARRLDLVPPEALSAAADLESADRREAMREAVTQPFADPDRGR
jgi:pyruvate/2-oxoacid:ferredoxin oxidoreductase beta subunit